ncbi:MAG: hypothetical protein ABJV04_18045 [Aliiglaciecola sp.]|uniref:hypothetical protein n=1 Tax=Aliiglaciecola sp. TaxID=1872441 RepID=UPI003297F2EF
MDANLLHITLEISRENTIIEKAGKDADFTKLVKLVKAHIVLSEELGSKSVFADNLHQLEKLQCKLKRYKAPNKQCNEMHCK